MASQCLVHSGKVIPEGHSKCLNHHDIKLHGTLQRFLVTLSGWRTA